MLVNTPLFSEVTRVIEWPRGVGKLSVHILKARTAGGKMEFHGLTALGEKFASKEFGVFSEPPHLPVGIRNSHPRESVVVLFHARLTGDPAEVLGVAIEAQLVRPSNAYSSGVGSVPPRDFVCSTDEKTAEGNSVDSLEEVQSSLFIRISQLRPYASSRGE